MSENKKNKNENILADKICNLISKVFIPKSHDSEFTSAVMAKINEADYKEALIQKQKKQSSIFKFPILSLPKLDINLGYFALATVLLVYTGINLISTSDTKSNYVLNTQNEIDSIQIADQIKELLLELDSETNISSNSGLFDEFYNEESQNDSSSDLLGDMIYASIEEESNPFDSFFDNL